MKPHGGQLAHRQFRASPADAADDLDIHAGLRARIQQPQHCGIADFRVVDQQLLLGPFQKRRELLARIHGTHDEGGVPRYIRLALGVGFEKFHRFGDQLGVGGHQSEAAAVVDVQVGKVKGQQKQLAAVDDQKLVVVARQVVGGARHGDAGFQQPHFQLPQISFAPAIGVGDQGMHEHAAGGGVGQGLFDLRAVEAEDGDFHAAFGAVDRVHQGRDPVAGLNQQFQTYSLVTL